jgi:hypothetical protein
MASEHESAGPHGARPHAGTNHRHAHEAVLPAVLENFRVASRQFPCCQFHTRKSQHRACRHGSCPTRCPKSVQTVRRACDCEIRVLLIERRSAHHGWHCSCIFLMDAAVTHPIADCAPQPVWMDKRRTPSHLSATGSAGALLALLLGYYWWFLPPVHPTSQPTPRIASRLSRHAWSVSSHSLTRLFVW